MENLEKRHIKQDLRPESARAIDEIEKSNDDLLKIAHDQLDIIEVSLHNLVDRIHREKPDYIIFLDKGARIFGTPLSKNLRSEGNYRPEIGFYNDDNLKQAYVGGTLNPSHFGNDFAHLSEKKVFFIDETFSTGKGAVAIREIINAFNIDAHYFALSRDPNQTVVSDRERSIFGDRLDGHQKTLRDLGKDSRFTIYDNPIDVLFSKAAGDLYVVDDESNVQSVRTKSRYKSLTDEELDNAYNYAGTLHAREWHSPLGAESWQEFDYRVRTSNMETVRKLKDLISIKLENEHDIADQ